MPYYDMSMCRTGTAGSSYSISYAAEWWLTQQLQQGIMQINPVMRGAVVHGARGYTVITPHAASPVYLAQPIS
jgi:hypothetical protein